jgi:hypothetical protein
MRIVSFVTIFVFVFFLGGWFLMPHLPPVPNHPISALELDYWKGNWAGAVLGLILATASARSAHRKQQRKILPGDGIAVEPVNPPRA